MTLFSQGQMQYSYHTVYLPHPVWTGRELWIGIKIDRPGLCCLVQLSCLHLEHCGVKSCCHTSALLCPLGAACTSLLLCQKNSFIHNRAITTHKSWVPIKVQDLTHALSDGSPLCKLKTCFAPCGPRSVIILQLQPEITSVSPAETQHYCRKVAINKAWRKEQISTEVVVVVVVGSAGSWSQPGLWQCETLAQREAQQGLRDDFLLCHACAHSANLPLVLSDGASLDPQCSYTLIWASSLCHTFISLEGDSSTSSKFKKWTQ